MQRYCVCGKEIAKGMRLCKECFDKYGNDSSEWPEWIKFFVNDVKREMQYEWRHRDLCIFDDEYFLPNKVRKTRPHFEKDFEDMLWSNQ
jgi:hypothetical protein